MCIAILKTKTGIITDEELRNCFKRNKDGAGIAYTVDNKLIVEKGIFNIDDFVSVVRAAEEICDNNMLIHCRITTSGNIDTLNCHPHILNQNMCMIHNGVLDIDVPKNSLVSDTIIYCNKVLKQIRNKDLLHNNAITKLIESHIGDYNKFVFLNNKGEYNIINEEVGHWKDGVWYSNESYKGYATVYGTGCYDWDDEDELAYYYGGYNYTGKFHWDKDDEKKDEDTKLLTTSKSENFVELEDVDGKMMTITDSAYIRCRMEVADSIEYFEDEDFEFYGEHPLVDMYDDGMLHKDSETAVFGEGLIYLDDIFPELYEIYKEKYKAYLTRLECRQAG